MATILVAEDDSSIALGLRTELTLEGYSVEVAGDGLTVMERARSGRFDLILLDVGLPKKDGYAICRELRQLGVRTPILMLTARAHEAEKVLGLELGADDYVSKPFSALELRARVRALLRRSASSDSPEIYRFGDLEVDMTRGEVRRNTSPIETTPLEFKLLTTFVRKRGRILTREQLLDAVWQDSSPTDRVIDNHIMNLRRKIEPNPQKPLYLVSVRGLGYRFEG